MATEVVTKVIEECAQKMGYESLKRQQKEAIFWFVQRFCHLTYRFWQKYLLWMSPNGI